MRPGHISGIFWNFFGLRLYRALSCDNGKVPPEMNEDEDSINRVLAGERDAFRSLVVRHQSAVCATIAALRPRAGDGEDLAQEVFLAAFRHLRTFDVARGSFRSWMLAITRNICRSAGNRPVAARLDGLGECADTRTPDSLATQAEWFQRLDSGLASLPEEQRLVFVLVELQGLSYREAAAIAAVNVGTVKSRLFRAKATLRELLRPDAGDRERVVAQRSPGSR